MGRLSHAHRHLIVEAGGGAVTPVIDNTSPAIGDTLTASESGTTTWQRVGVGDIGGATGQTYTLVDADWGYPITVTVNGLTSAATSRVRETPAQALGSELVVNGNMESGDPPSSWTATLNCVLDGVADERTGGAGSQALDIEHTATATSRAQQSGIAAALGAWVEARAWGKVVDVPNFQVILMEFSPATAIKTIMTSTDTNWRTSSVLARLTSAGFSIRLTSATGSSGQHYRVDDVSVKVVTPNAQLAAPSADMRIDFMYSLAAGQSESLTLRSRIDSDGNWWAVELTHILSSDTWSIDLYSVVSFVRTNRINAAGIGITNGIRINMNADTITLYTTANGGTNWTSRGSTSNSLYQSDTGVNALWTSGVTPGQLIFAPAD